MNQNAELVLNDEKSLKPKALLGIRHVQTALMFSAIFVSYSMRVNMSIAIVAMTDKDDDNTFDWSMQRQSVILSSFAWGYFILNIPAGELAAKFGGSILITIIVAGNAIISLLIPTAAYYGGWQTVCACRVLQGLSQGFLYPSCHNLLSKWAPLEEKSRLGALIYAGGPFGSALQLVMAGFIIHSWGWPSIFYVNGVLGAIWVVAYIILGADSPQKSKIISDEEKLYIQNSLGHVGKQKKFKTPWKAILTSLPFYALIIIYCGHSWGLWTLMTEMPSYMKQILGVDIKANGVMSALPYLAKYLLTFPFAFFTDYILKKKWVSITAARKVSTTIGECGPAVALIGLSFVPAGNVALAVTLLTLVVGLNAGHYTGAMLVHIDMAPNFGGTLIGITCCFANIIAIIAPLMAGLILTNESDPNQWHQVFYVSSAIYIAANIFFLIFGTGERQSWNEPAETNNGTEEKAEKVV